KDFDDVMAAVDHVVQMGVADPERLGVGGWSYGGILTDNVITRTGRFKAAISGASEANYLSNYGTDHYQYEWETELGLPWRNVERWVRMSPWFRVDKITTPTLLMGGSDDMNVPLLNSEQLYQALRRLGVPSELVIYPGQTHGPRRENEEHTRGRASRPMPTAIATSLPKRLRLRAEPSLFDRGHPLIEITGPATRTPLRKMEAAHECRRHPRSAPRSDTVRC